MRARFGCYTGALILHTSANAFWATLGQPT